MRVIDRVIVGLFAALFTGGGVMLGRFVGLELAEAGYIENPGPFDGFGVRLCWMTFAVTFAGGGGWLGSWVVHRWRGWAVPERWTKTLLIVLIMAPLVVGGNFLGRFVGLELAEAGYIEYRPFDGGAVGVCAAAGGLVFVVVGVLVALWIVRRHRRRGRAVWTCAD